MNPVPATGLRAGVHGCGIIQILAYCASSSALSVLAILLLAIPGLLPGIENLPCLAADHYLPLLQPRTTGSDPAQESTRVGDDDDQLTGLHHVNDARLALLLTFQVPHPEDFVQDHDLRIQG